MPHNFFDTPRGRSKVGAAAASALLAAVYPALLEIDDLSIEVDASQTQLAGMLADHLEPRNDGYGYQVKEGRIDSVLEIFHRSNGQSTPKNAAGFWAFRKRDVVGDLRFRSCR
jgi:hypothetical protein